MFRLANLKISIAILCGMALQVFLALSKAPLPFNPLFFVFDDAGTIRFSQQTFWYLLLPAHSIEALVALFLAVKSGKVENDLAVDN